MGQDLTGIIDQLNKDLILMCSKCKSKYNLTNKTPFMVCANQHNCCERCLQTVKRAKKCEECNESLLLNKKRNVLLCYIINKLNMNGQQISEKISQKLGKSSKFESSPKITRNESSPFGLYQTMDSPERKAIKIKSVKQQSVQNINIEQYQEQREFRKKYSVAAIFSSKQVPSPPKLRNSQQMFQDQLKQYVEQYQIIPFKNMLSQKKGPTLIFNLDLHLYKIPNIFPVFSKFTSLLRLNMNKNRIEKIQHLSQMKQLNYLSLSENHIQRIENLENLTNLKNLYLNKNKINSIQNLDNLIELQFLGLGFNYIQKIQRISHLAHLKWINLEGNYISKVEGFLLLKNLEIILLGSNEISEFEGFENLPSLQEIHIQNNKISNISKALSMKDLRKIKLEDNPGLQQENSQDYIKLLSIIEAKSKGVEKPQEQCRIY